MIKIMIKNKDLWVVWINSLLKGDWKVQVMNIYSKIKKIPKNKQRLTFGCSDLH